MKKIEDLLNSYFEGETSCEEERQLRQYFAEGIIPEHLEIYRPMFAYLHQENRESKLSAPTGKKMISFRRRLFYSISGVAAVALMALTIGGIIRHQNALPENYVMIDGKCYTDADLVHQEALAAFQEVKLSEEDVFATLFSE